MKSVLQQDKQTIEMAKKLASNGQLNEAYQIYVKLIGKYNLFSGPDLDGVLLETAKIIKKFSNIPLNIENFFKQIVTKLTTEADSFPKDLESRVFLLQHYTEGFYKAYFNLISNESDIPHNIITTLNYKAYFHQPNSKNNYKIFLGKTQISFINNASYNLNFFGFDNLFNLSLDSLEFVLSEFSKYGFIGQSLQIQNSWSDTLAHKEIFWGNTNKALLYLSYAEKFSSKFIKKYIYNKRNYQGENWLYDIANRTREDNLVDNFVKFLANKKLQHLTLLENFKISEPYLITAAKQDNFQFVKGILLSVKEQSQKLDVEQRIFNFTALELERYYNAKAGMMEFLRELGIKEYKTPIDLESYEINFIKDSQNVHRAEFAQPLVNAVKALEVYYKKNTDFVEKECKDFILFFHSLFDSIKESYLLDFLSRNKCSVFPEDINFTIPKEKSEKHKILKDFLEHTEFIISRIIEPQNFSNPYNKDILNTAKEWSFPQKNKVYDNFTLKHALAFTWAGLKDTKAFKEKVLSNKEILDRQLIFLINLYETYKEGIEGYNELNEFEEADIEMEDVKSDSNPPGDVSKTEKEEISKGSNNTVKSLNEDNDFHSKHKIPGIICFTGLFDRMIYTLNKCHDLVDIEVKPIETNVTIQAIEERFQSIEQDFISEVTNQFLLARIYDNFELIKNNDLSKTFIPLQQYILGILKRIFTENASLGFFGAKATKEGVQHTDFILFEKTLEKFYLKNPIKKALDYINSKNINTIQSCALKLKVFINALNSNKIDYPEFIKILLVNEVSKNFSGLLKDEDIDSITVALNVTNPNYFKEMKNTVLEKDSIIDKFEEIFSVICNKFSTKKLASSEHIKYIFDEAIMDLSKKTSWNGFDILKFHIITSQNKDYNQPLILTKLFKSALIENNLYLVKTIINKAENLYEREVALQEREATPHEYYNAYLKEIAENDFGKGLTILHLVAIHCSSKEILDLILNYREFREQLDIKDEQGCTPFYLAVFNKNLAAMEKFTEYGADINILDNKGNAPIHTASRHANFALIKDLVEKGLNPFAVNNINETFLHVLANKEKEKDPGIGLQAFETFLKKAIPVGEDILSYFLEPIKAICDKMDYEDPRSFSKHFNLNAYESDIKNFLENPKVFIKEFCSTNIHHKPFLFEDGVYGLLLDAAIVLKNEQAVKNILSFYHPENILTYVDQTTYSPISNAIISWDNNILSMINEYIKKHHKKIIKIKNMDEEDRENILNTIKFPSSKEFDPNDCYNSFLAPLYSVDSLKEISELVQALGELSNSY